MSKRNLYLMLLVSIFLPVVYSKNAFFEYYYNKYHKHSSTANTLSSVTESASTEAISSLDDHSSEEISPADDENLSSPSITFKEGANTSYPSVIFRSGEETDYSRNSRIGITIAIVFGSVFFIVLCLGCLCCCCCCPYKGGGGGGSDSTGFIIRNNREERGIEVNPQPIITQYPSPPAGFVIQHCPPDSSQTPIQQFPPPYHQPAMSQYHQHPAMPQYDQQEVFLPNQQQAVQSQTQYAPMQPEFQYSPNSMNFHNPPEAPPPYAPTAPTKF